MYKIESLGATMEIQLADGINIVAVLGVGFWLHRELAGLRERMAKLEGLFEGAQRSMQPPPSGPP